MPPKFKKTKEMEFAQSLLAKKEKDDAEYLAKVQARTDGIKRTLSAQHRKDQYDKIMREFDDPDMRVSTTVNKHRERIEFLENVLNENRQWRANQSEPLQLKPNLVMLQAKINEMKQYVADRVAGKAENGLSRSVVKNAGKVESKINPDEKLRKLTSEQILSVYELAMRRIESTYGGLIERLAKNVREGLPIERARERLEALGVSKYAVEALNKIDEEQGLGMSDEEKRSVKMYLLQPGRMGKVLEKLIESKT
jgi:hypothetical protein